MTETYQETSVQEKNQPVVVEKQVDSNLLARKVTRAIWIFASVVDALLGFRFLLKLFAANPASPFAKIIYMTTDFFVYPFHNLLSNPSIGNGVFEVTTLIAVLAYIFLTWLLIQFALLIFKK